ncbi:MAG: DUF4367 domain-containing protein [Oscillospiraceae bacterium]|nr:DUF4367 domain-containing protein [Oscillospiraceae bacterium]
MSNQDKVNKGRGNFLENCTITELEELLNAAAQDVPIDEAYVAELEAAILRCETERPTGRLSEPDEAWERFRRTRLAGDTSRLGLSNKGKVCKTVISMEGKRQPRRPRRLGRALLIAAVIVVMMTLLLPPVLGYRSIFHMVAQWTDEQFRFVAPTYGSPETVEENSEQKDMMPLMESLEEYGLPLSFAPSWFPEDKQFLEEEYRETENGKTYYTAIFADEGGEKLVYFKLIEYPEAVIPKLNSFIWEKDDSAVVEFSCNGITHYIVRNNGFVGAHWYVDSFEVAILGDISIEEAKKIVESIYER